MIEGQDRLRIRSRYYPLVGGSVVIGAAIYGVWQGLDDPELGAGFAVGWAAVAAVLLYRLVRVALIEKHDRLVVRNSRCLPGEAAPVPPNRLGDDVLFAGSRQMDL